MVKMSRKKTQLYYNVTVILFCPLEIEDSFIDHTVCYTGTDNILPPLMQVDKETCPCQLRKNILFWGSQNI